MPRRLSLILALFLAVGCADRAADRALEAPSCVVDLVLSRGESCTASGTFLFEVADASGECSGSDGVNVSSDGMSVSIGSDGVNVSSDGMSVSMGDQSICLGSGATGSVTRNGVGLESASEDGSEWRVFAVP